MTWASKQLGGPLTVRESAMDCPRAALYVYGQGPINLSWQSARGDHFVNLIH